MTVAPVEIIEILGPAEQGRCEPYLCRGEDGLQYYVKGRQSSRRSLWCEWLCAHLAQAFGLPVPPFRLVNVSSELLAEAPEAWRCLGNGPAFGSERRENRQWLETALADGVPAELRRDILAFDWWVRNLDRMDGNPNLLWSPTGEGLSVIDFNLAFDPIFSLTEFRAVHLFRGEITAVFGDLAESANYLARFETALEVWDEACDNAPPEWWWENDEQDVPAAFDPAAARALLARLIDPQDPECWRIG